MQTSVFLSSKNRFRATFHIPLLAISIIYLKIQTLPYRQNKIYLILLTPINQDVCLLAVMEMET